LELSVVIPIFNESESIPLLYEELIESLSWVPENDYEIIFVDDGSSDKSLKLLKELQIHDDHVIIINFRRNFGQTAALSAGFDNASGRIIATLDADLQNDPHDIRKMVNKLNEGFDLVCGWRFDRKDKYFTRRLPSIIANKLISYATKVKLHDYGCTLKVFRKELVELIRLYGEMHRFIPAIASGKGARIAEVKVNHRPRKFGNSKYGITRIPRVILDLMTVKFLLDYSTRPIQVFGLTGIFSIFIGGIIFIMLIIQRQFFGIELGNRPMLLFSILLLFIGLQFITMGLLGELQIRTYHESQQKPIYVIREIIK
jgi:glycosyltransferase involved in cell wall biosynthesis